MEHHLYLSLIPESLVVSMLPADEFGMYLAVGTKKRAKEEAIYFEIKSDFESEYFDLQKALQHCTPHESGRPKHSVYVSEPYGIRAQISSDNAKTWSNPIHLRDDGAGRDLGYVRSVQRSDGKIIFVYYFCDKQSPERYIAATIWGEK